MRKVKQILKQREEARYLKFEIDWFESFLYGMAMAADKMVPIVAISWFVCFLNNLADYGDGAIDWGKLESVLFLGTLMALITYHVCVWTIAFHSYAREEKAKRK